MSAFLLARMADSDLGVLINVDQIISVLPVMENGLPHGAAVLVEGARIPLRESVSRIAEALAAGDGCTVVDVRRQGNAVVMAGVNGHAATD